MGFLYKLNDCAIALTFHVSRKSALKYVVIYMACNDSLEIIWRIRSIMQSAGRMLINEPYFDPFIFISIVSLHILRTFSPDVNLIESSKVDLQRLVRLLKNKSDLC